MFRLHGFPVSNYTNMVQLALLEKGVPFDYVLAYPDQGSAFLDKSARGKVPVLETPQGFVSETSVILDYLEDCGEGRPLLPQDPFARAQARMLTRMIELYIELPARACFGEAIFGLSTPEAIKDKSRDELVAGFAALKRRAKFAPYVAGDTFSTADIVFLYAVELAALVGKNLWGLDLLGDLPQARKLRQRLGQNPHVQAIATKRDAGTADFIKAVRARYVR